MGVKMLLKHPESCRTMEQPISQKHILLMAIGQRPSMSFAIPNNMLTPSTKATNQGISPRATTTVA